MSDETQPGDAAAPKDKGFEATVAELERVVDALERGQLPLEEALRTFEQGMALAKKASTILEAAERRVDQLVEERDGGVREVPFEE